MPKAGSMRIYTSGWPKNQNRCWNSSGSPPALASKKLVLKHRSVSSMVIPPANTGMARSRSIAVMSSAQAYRGSS